MVDETITFRTLAREVVDPRSRFQYFVEMSINGIARALAGITHESERRRVEVGLRDKYIAGELYEVRSKEPKRCKKRRPTYAKRRRKARLGWLYTRAGRHVIILSNGTELCSCPTRAAADRIYKALAAIRGSK